MKPDHIIIDVHHGSQSESWLVVYKDGRVKHHVENDGWAYMRHGPEAEEKFLTAEEVRKLGRSGAYPPSDARPFVVRVREAVRKLNEEIPMISTHTAIAECEYCEGQWQLVSGTPPEHLQGACMDCQADRDVEKPLTFRAPRVRGEGVGLPGLPLSWLAGYQT